MNEIKAQQPYVPDFGYGCIEAGSIWPEPKNDQASALYRDANFEKAFKIDDISSVFHYELINDIGGLNPYSTTQGKGELGCDLDEILSEDKVVNLYPTLSLTNASEDYVLDVDFSKKVPELDYQFCEELSFGNSSSAIRSPLDSNEIVGVPESSVSAPKCFKNQCGQTTSGVGAVSESKCGSDNIVEDEMTLSSLSYDLQDVHEAGEVQNLFEAGSSLDHNVKTTCVSLTSSKASCTSTSTHTGGGHPVSENMKTEEVCTDDMSSDSSPEVKIAIARQRRLCKPPQRYLEGFAMFDSRLNRARNCSTSSSKDKDTGVRSQRKYHRKAKAPRAVEELDSDEEYDPLPSKFSNKCKNRSYQKKSNNLWTLAEVVSLVDGIAHFGLGRWTAIKRTFFGSSYRTATDIRDKWRNLVKTNCRSLKSKTEDDRHHRNGSQQLPKAVVERVRELAIANHFRL